MGNKNTLVKHYPSGTPTEYCPRCNQSVALGDGRGTVLSHQDRDHNIKKTFFHTDCFEPELKVLGLRLSDISPALAPRLQEIIAEESEKSIYAPGDRLEAAQTLSDLLGFNRIDISTYNTDTARAVAPDKSVLRHLVALGKLDSYVWLRTT